MSSAIKDDNLSYISSSLIRRNLFVEKALQGFAEEQFQLALHFLDGTKGFPQSHKHALYWLIQSSNNGNIEAVNQLGVCFMNGWGTIKNNEAAFHLIKFAADYGDLTAIVNVALMCVNGCGTPIDLKQASLYLKKASLLGNGAASYQLGQMYLHGWGVDVDGSTGFEYLTLAADQGVVEAKERLNGTISPPVIRECWQEKRADLEKLANAGNIDAMYRLSQYCERGIDGNIDKMAHLKWLEKAAENRHQQAWSDLQSLYANYDNLDADFKEMITRSRGNSDPEEKDPHVDTPENRKQKLAKRRSLIFRMFHKISVVGSAAH